ncbi:hypothetical protein PGTUg99_032493 [Puccinia graminis f. sp. tritici]|uniref:Uncharacterized protein n=1 Tax=Puccinia graminis f. sp. tritici TaxID=56615 RepID=A0A5B0S2Y6_PUCGR|nr:hypothetical protein PGTUg99_032493 [Puccinia graminis f. sp. tritici]
MGKAWDLLTDDEKEVFGSRVFQHFSKIPCGYDDEEDDDDTSGQLTPEEIGLYEPLYQLLVNHEKVKAFTANRPESEGQNTGEVYKKALKNVLKLNSELYTTSNMYNTTYYLLSATRAPGINSFCKEYSNDPAWLALAEKRWNSKETFEAYSHGRQIQASLEDIEGGPASSKPLREGDTLKKKLRAALNRLLANALRLPKATFRKNADPAKSILEKDSELRIVQSEGSRLSKDALLLGFEKMQKLDKEKWMADIESGHFKIEKVQSS